MQEKYMIYLKSVEIDTRIGEPDLPEILRYENIGTSEKGYFIVQFTDEIKTNWREQIQSVGVELLGYVPNNAFLSRMTNHQAMTIREFDFIQWVGIYQPAYKISPTI